MNERRRGAPDPFEVVIDKIVYGGAGLGRHEGKVVFVPFTAPGDRVIVRPVEQKKKLIHATVERLVVPGPARSEPFCVHFGTCGGCQWQHLEYAAQVEIKHSILEELFHHHLPETRALRIDMKPSPQDRGYRSRARIQFRGRGSESAIGFFGYQSHGVIDVATCPLLRPTLSAALRSLRELWEQGRADPGMRQAEIACSEEETKWNWVEIEPSLEEGFSLLGKNPDAEGGGATLTRKVGQFEYKITPSIFFQANDFMVAELLSTVENLVGEGGPGSALDLFAGVGLFTLPLARHFSQVTAVEASAEACRLCRENSKAAGLENVRVTNGGAAPWMKAVSSVTSPAFDLIILDPPRTGAGPGVIEKIREWAPNTVIYVSCDPQTLVRDLALLAGRDYRIDFVLGLDLFPQTYHFETVVRLTHR